MSNPANGWPYNFRSRATTVNLSPWFCPSICVVEDVSTASGHSDLGILSNLGSILQFSPECTGDTASAACPSQPGNRAITSMIFEAVPLGCRWALYQCELRIGSRVVFHNVHTGEPICLLYFCSFGVLTPHHSGNICPSNVAKWPLFLSLCASRINVLRALSSKLHAGIVSSFFHSLSTAAFASGIFIDCGIGITLCTKL